eukprot:4578645-Amphidinium_carterae.1
MAMCFLACGQTFPPTLLRSNALSRPSRVSLHVWQGQGWQEQEEQGNSAEACRGEKGEAVESCQIQC